MNFGGKMEKVGLVLSGGSAYGFAHIGVLKVLEKNNIPVDIIAGTSMGAIVGGMYSAGMSTKQMEETLKGFSRNKIVDVNLFGVFNEGLLYGKKVSKFFSNLIGDKNIEDCEKKFCCVASDLVSGKKYVFEKGSLVQAIRASMSIPGIFKPVKIDKMCLVDGGISDNLPVEDARRLGATKIISVDVCTYYKKQNHLKSAVDVVISATNLLTSNYVKQISDKGDVYIKIDQPNVSFDKFSASDITKSIAYGEKYAKKMLPEIKKMLNMNE